MTEGEIMRVYIDTSVIGGCLDIEFAEGSNSLLHSFVDGPLRPVISPLVLAELAEAPRAVQDIFENTLARRVELVFLTDEVEMLANRYIEEQVIGSVHREDARHIAAASVHRVDVLASWNFKHIVNLHRIRGYNGVNMLLGYPQIEIRSPLEVVPYAEEN